MQKFAVIKQGKQLIVMDNNELFNSELTLNVVVSPYTELRAGEYSILDVDLDFTQAMSYINTAKAYLP